ncbi:unnamed protein product [Rotaria sordida]|uniref:Riboflavin transporter n=1 Tax=Rotaria sordida TaxID=392033 RepID=A0A818WL84_9BILA|nr:unnamed protein product [Rotaria sordida]
MVPIIELFKPSKPMKHIPTSTFIFLLSLNTYNSFVLYGILPSLTTYSLLPYGQKVFYYFCLLNPLSYSISLLVSVKWSTLSVRMTIIGTIIGSIIAVFIIIIATQSPCPWWADTLHGALIMLAVWFVMTIIIAYLRITTGNLIKGEWLEEKGMFYFGITVQLGLFMGAVPVYLLINVFNMFIDRKPCQIYCVT